MHLLRFLQMDQLLPGVMERFGGDSLAIQQVNSGLFSPVDVFSCGVNCGKFFRR